ncbi:hypothetical protein HY750_01220 [Candidatus Kuenenbacteria bacterium]|nr:hypothetical protein [Candidatus Kuenenbacteria bacterium]
MPLSNDKKKTILWLSVSIITVVIIIIWGFFLKKDLGALKIQLQQKKELSPKDLQFKKDLEELKKSLQNVQQGILNVKTTVEKENVKTEEQKNTETKKQENTKTQEQKNIEEYKLSLEQMEELKEKIKEKLH